MAQHFEPTVDLSFSPKRLRRTAAPVTSAMSIQAAEGPSYRSRRILIPQGK